MNKILMNEEIKYVSADIARIILCLTYEILISFHSHSLLKLKRGTLKLIHDVFAKNIKYQ